MEDNAHIQTGQKHKIALSNVDSIVSLSIDNKNLLYSTMMTGSRQMCVHLIRAGFVSAAPM